MQRIIIVATGLVVAAVPAVLGVAGNTSLTTSVPLRPAAASATPTPGTDATTSSSTPTTPAPSPSPSPSADDHGGDRATRHDEPGDEDRSERHTEADDHGRDD